MRICRATLAWRHDAPAMTVIDCAQIQGGARMTTIRKLTLAAAFVGAARRAARCRAGAISVPTPTLAAARREVHPAVRAGQRHRHRGAADRRQARRQVGQAGGGREPAGRRRAPRHQRLHLGRRRPRAALRIERQLHRAPVHAGEGALRHGARPRADRARQRHRAVGRRAGRERLQDAARIRRGGEAGARQAQLRRRAGPAGVRRHGVREEREPRHQQDPLQGRDAGRARPRREPHPVPGVVVSRRCSR